MLKRLKFGMTMSEVLVAMGVIGIITAVMLTSYRPRQAAVRYQFRSALTAVEKAFFNSYTGGFESFGIAGRTVNIDDTDYEIVRNDTTDTGSQIVCFGLTRYINTINAIDADHDWASSCSATRVVSINGDDLTADNVQFTARANNMAFWISKLYEPAANATPSVKFYMVFVDVNGLDRGPNSFADNGEAPDRYALALLPNGKVTPIGRPEFDTRVATARVMYYNELEQEVVDDTSTSFIETKARAWGYYNGGIANPAVDIDLIDAHILNDYVRSKLSANSPILSGFPANLALETQVAADLGCEAGNFNPCFVYIDEYRW